jgi:hypothetical protein
MKYTIREEYGVTWFKRRAPTKNIPKAIDVRVVDFLKKRGHLCEMHAEYDDGNTYILGAQVHHNTIKDTWTIQGLDAIGHSVVLDITEF